MKKKLLPILISSLGLSLITAPVAQADKAKRNYNQHYGQHQSERIDYAKVVNVKPIYETVSYSEPYEECHYEERRVRNHRDSNTAIILGSLIGGAIGNELGHNKSNKRVGAVAGAVLGGSIARDIDRSKRGYRVRNEKVCTTAYQVKYKEELTAYDVAYKYRGMTYYTTMDEHPGKRIRVAVSVRPVI